MARNDEQRNGALFNRAAAPEITLPRGGGALRGIDEKFAANPATGTASMTVPLAISPGRAGFTPQLALSYDSGAGNGPFGLGWSVALPAISRKTDSGLPLYRDADDSDVFLLSGAEDLVPVLKKANGNWVEEEVADRTVGTDQYAVRRYRPRIEGLFARIERWTQKESGDAFWRSISRDNVTTFYGKTAESRMVDPTDPRRIFSWLICESYDDKGNVIAYEYEREDGRNVDETLAHERNRARKPKTREANRYIKRIKYGNKTSRLAKPADYHGDGWHFEIVFDYDEGHCVALPDTGDGHAYVRAASAAASSWPVRKDPFSSYRAGFEVRSYRLCRRVLMFHSFPELGTTPCLARSTDITYSESPIASFITAVTQCGYVRQRDASSQFINDYLKRSLPPVDFGYSRVPTPAELASQPVVDADAASLENLPVGLDGSRYQWVDLDGEGLAGVLSEHLGSWYYKSNLGSGGFGPMTPVSTVPVVAKHGGRHQLLDLAGDGQLDVVLFETPLSGFHERTLQAAWEPFRSYELAPNVRWGDPNLRFIDLTGDGHADLVVSEHDAFVWHASLAEAGFGPAQRVAQALDEEEGPRLVFADGTQTIFLADMSGDGLTDLVRIRNGEVCYWPNVGYGRFGAKVTMDGAPWFDAPDLFDPNRIRLADTDGSGVTDIIYLRHNGARLYFNQSGNGWSDAAELPQFPRIDELATVQVLDLLGSGTACLVWSSPLPRAAGRQLRYVDLMGGHKPHLLISTANNLGAATLVHYAASTRFFLEDKRAGKPWISRLPFPVHVVERVETCDRVSRNRFITRYTYHHGYFDGAEREFRGFGMVEQWDTEELAALGASGTCPDPVNLDAAWHVPPVCTRTWFHTGIHAGGERASNFFAGLGDAQGEYYREPAWGADDVQAAKYLLPDTVLPPDLTPEEEREARRALKGLMLRQEVYAADGSSSAEHPYSVLEQNFTVRRLQPRGKAPNAVFLVHARETIRHHYERNPDDPRVSHALTLEVDNFGSVLKFAAIAYGRRHGKSPLQGADKERQEQLLVTYTENDVTDAVHDSVKHPDDHRAPMPYETRVYEVTGFALATDASRFSFDDFEKNGFQALTSLSVANYEAPTDYTKKEKRLIERVRILYRKDDLSALLGTGKLDPRALPGESYQLALTPGLLSTTFVASGKVVAGALPQLLSAECKYVDFDGDGHWWIPSGQIRFAPSGAPNAASYAAQHFFLPQRLLDAFGKETQLRYDTNDLLLREVEDALGNKVTARNDYRVLQPALVADPNGNRTAVSFDALGLVVGTAVMGKASESIGDSVASFPADLTQAQLQAFFADPKGQAKALLGDATTRIVYDVERYRRSAAPSFAATIARETHVSDPLPPGGLRMNFSFSDGFGREIQKKMPAEPDPATQAQRWVGTGWAVFNNKGKPVRNYEPFFDDTHDFKFGIAFGVSSVLFYDPLERVVATLHSNDAYEKVVFDAWRRSAYDVNDTSRLDPRSDPDIAAYTKPYFASQAASWKTWLAQRIDPQNPPADSNGQEPEQDAAVRTRKHANTPAIAHLDPLGRAFMSILDNGPDANGDPQLFATRSRLDPEGKPLAVIDALGREATEYRYDVAGNVLYEKRLDSGARWTLNHAAGKPVRAWDDRKFQRRIVYDALGRPTGLYVSANGAPEILAERTEYGESKPAAESTNHRTRVWKLHDAAGRVVSERYDFKGNLLRSTRTFLKSYSQKADWSATPQPNLETESFSSRTSYDALNRPLQLVAPRSDQPGTKINVIQPVYNEANLLERVDVWLRRAQEPTQLLASVSAQLHAVKNMQYDARGQRELVEFGNGAKTDYSYDPLTFRLTQLTTTRSGFAANAKTVQDLTYTYDPAGNITHIQDDADIQNVVYFKNRRVEPSADYHYDPIYRLVRAAGREHLGLVAITNQPHTPRQLDHADTLRIGLSHPSDGKAMGTYVEEYLYDAVGNFLEMKHRGSGPQHAGWSRKYLYDGDLDAPPQRRSNRLASTQPAGPNEASRTDYTHDAHGNMTSMPHLQQLVWNFKDQLEKVDLGGGGTAYYIYDAGGQRVRKVIERQNGTRDKQRLYLGGFEIYREYNGAGTNVLLERETLHVMDDKQRIALVETKTVDNAAAIAMAVALVRYQIGNHLGSSMLELNDAGEVISYEEYYSYGSTSYQAVTSNIEVPAKRYRYTGKERDEESALDYYGARYYAAWLGRWLSCDPIGNADGPNAYLFNRGNPVSLLDRDGMQSGPDVYSQLPPWLQKKIMAGEINDRVSSTVRTARLKEFVNVQPTRATTWEDRVLDVATFGTWSIGQTGAKNYDEVSSAPATSEWHPAAKALAATGMTAGDITGTRDIVEGLREQDTLNTRTFSPEESAEKVQSGAFTLGTVLLAEALPAPRAGKQSSRGSTANAAKEAFDESLVNVREGRMGSQTHSSAGKARKALGMPTTKNPSTGLSNFESSHLVPQAVGELIPGYSAGKAVTNNLPESVHKLFDSGWMPEWERLKASGKRVTAGDIQKMLDAAIDRIPDEALSAKAKGTMKWQIELELQSLGLTPQSEIIPAAKHPPMKINLRGKK